MEIAENRAVSFSFLPCPADFRKNVIPQCTFGERLGKTRMADRLFIAVAFRQRSEGASNVSDSSPIDTEVGQKPEALLSAKVRCQKATAMKIYRSRAKISRTQDHLSDCQRPDTCVSYHVTIVARLSIYQLLQGTSISGTEHHCAAHDRSGSSRH